MRRTTLLLVAAAATMAFAPSASATHCDRFRPPLDAVCRNGLPERCYWTEHGIVCEYE